MAAGKEMVVDSTLNLSARRNVPIRCNRDLVATALKAMACFSEIRMKRERIFDRQRIQGKRQRQLDQDRSLVEENQHLLPMSQRVQVQVQETSAMELDEDTSHDREVVKEVETQVKRNKSRVKKQELKLLRAGGIE